MEAAGHRPARLLGRPALRRASEARARAAELGLDRGAAGRRVLADRGARHRGRHPARGVPNRGDEGDDPGRGPRHGDQGVGPGGLSHAAVRPWDVRRGVRGDHPVRSRAQALGEDLHPDKGGGGGQARGPDPQPQAHQVPLDSVHGCRRGDDLRRPHGLEQARLRRQGREEQVHRGGEAWTAKGAGAGGRRQEGGGPRGPVLRGSEDDAAGVEPTGREPRQEGERGGGGVLEEERGPQGWVQRRDTAVRLRGPAVGAGDGCARGHPRQAVVRRRGLRQGAPGGDRAKGDPRAGAHRAALDRQQRVGAQPRGLGGPERGLLVDRDHHVPSPSRRRDAGQGHGGLQGVRRDDAERVGGPGRAGALGQD
mmetsp:Transcript_1586/g.4989  ORF Transcript_1586/g.4989 Transcript_1586/m.4989 type:complete len:366 (+) Transcript_1586:570-1667(+)